MSGASPAAQTARFIARFRRLCDEHAFVRKAWLFGSRALGDALPSSDFDLAVQCPDATAAQWDRFVDQVEGLTLLTADMHRWEDMSEDFRARVRETGEVVYERTEAAGKPGQSGAGRDQAGGGPASG